MRLSEVLSMAKYDGWEIGFAAGLKEGRRKMRNMSFKNTERGFSRIDFDDLYGERCSLQKSSLATEDAIWLGQNDPTVHKPTGSMSCRMHLSQEDVRWLLPILQHFADTGELPPAVSTPSSGNAGGRETP